MLITLQLNNIYFIKKALTMTYRPYWKSEFQKCLSDITNTGNLLYWEEVSEELSNSPNIIWEYVYKFNLRNKAAWILIYSSVYKETDRSREISSDAVRIVIVWNTKSGLKYYPAATKYRVENLFNNVQHEIQQIAKNCFNLNTYAGWVEHMP